MRENFRGESQNTPRIFQWREAKTVKVTKKTNNAVEGRDPRTFFCQGRKAVVYENDSKW